MKRWNWDIFSIIEFNQFSNCIVWGHASTSLLYTFIYWEWMHSQTEEKRTKWADRHNSKSKDFKWYTPQNYYEMKWLRWKIIKYNQNIFRGFRKKNLNGKIDWYFVCIFLSVCVCVFMCLFCGLMNVSKCGGFDSIWYCENVFCVDESINCSVFYLDKLVLRPFRQTDDVAFLACCVRRIIQRSNCSSSISFIIWRSRKSGLSNKYAVTFSADKSTKIKWKSTDKTQKNVISGRFIHTEEWMWRLFYQYIYKWINHY